MEGDNVHEAGSGMAHYQRGLDPRLQQDTKGSVARKLHEWRSVLEAAPKQQSGGQVSEGTWRGEGTGQGEQPNSYKSPDQSPCGPEPEPRRARHRASTEEDRLEPSTTLSTGMWLPAGGNILALARLQSRTHSKQSSGGGQDKPWGHLGGEGEQGCVCASGTPGTEAGLDFMQGLHPQRKSEFMLSSCLSLSNEHNDLTEEGAGLGWRWFPGHSAGSQAHSPGE